MLTDRQKQLLEVVVENLESVWYICWNTSWLDYDWVELDLLALADDIRIEFELSI